MAVENDNFPSELYVRNSELLPAPFDPHVASINIRSDANLANEGYNVFLSADLGSEVISLTTSGGEEIDVLLEIMQAEVTLNFPKGEVQLGRGYLENFGDEFRQQPSKINRTVALENEAALELGVAPKAIVSRKKSTTESGQHTEIFANLGFSHPDIRMIRIGNWRSTIPLIGPQVSNYLGWRVRPESNEVSGVLAKINVRKSWIEFSKPTLSDNGPVGRLLAKLSKSSNEFDRQKVELFPSLLRELVFIQLQRPGETKTATLAVSGLIVEMGESERSIQTQDAANEIRLPDNLLLRFLNSEPGTETNAHKLIVSDAKQLRKLEKSVFLPTAPYSNCLEAYLDIRVINSTTNGEFDRKQLVKLYGTKVVTALFSLGLLIGNGRQIRLVEPFPSASPVLAFEAIVKRQEVIRIADDYLIENPHAKGMELGKTLKSALGKTWSDGTCERYGHEIRKWARQQSLTLDRKGPPMSIGPREEELILKIISEGGGSKEIVQVLSVSLMTLNNWRNSEANTRFTRIGVWRVL